jgi:hypothetical protein
MKLAPSLAIASVAGSATFSLAWLRVSDLAHSSLTACEVFIQFLIPIFLITFMLGFPIAYAFTRHREPPWWLCVAIAAAVGALIGYSSTGPVVGSSEVTNPFALSFSPWHRHSPGFIDGTPVVRAEVLASSILGAVVGSILGFVFWLLYIPTAGPNKSLGRTREG